MHLSLVFIASYLLGSFPSSIVIGKLFFGIDIREHGSGNAGGTNTFRILGKIPGISVMALDVLKGSIATLFLAPIAFGHVQIDDTTVRLLAGFAAVIGHIWTIFAGFKGGKGVGTAAGMIIVLAPWVTLTCIALFGIIVYFSGIVSLGSITAGIALPILAYVIEFLGIREYSSSLHIVSIIAGVLIVFTHRSNIQRLLAGTENSFKKAKAGK